GGGPVAHLSCHLAPADRPGAGLPARPYHIPPAVVGVAGRVRRGGGGTRPGDGVGGVGPCGRALLACPVAAGNRAAPLLPRFQRRERGPLAALGPGRQVQEHTRPLFLTRRCQNRARPALLSSVAGPGGTAGPLTRRRAMLLNFVKR